MISELCVRDVLRETERDTVRCCDFVRVRITVAVVEGEGVTVTSWLRVVVVDGATDMLSVIVAVMEMLCDCDFVKVCV